MRSKRSLIGVATAAMLALGVTAAPPSEAHPRGHGGHHVAGGGAVLAWNEIAVDTLTALPGPAGGAPPASQVHMAMVQGAVYDAVIATEPRRYRPYLMRKRLSPRASTAAAVAAAANLVLSDIVSTVPGLADDARTSLQDTLAMQYADALALVPDGWAERKGIAAGSAAAAAMIEARAGDGRFGPSPWVPDTSVGHWWPQTNPATGEPVLDPTPWVGAVEPFLVRSASQFRTPGPPALTSARWAAQLNEVKAIGAVDSATRSEEQTYIARWWQSTPVRSWNEVGRDLAQRSGLDARDTARLLALQNLGGADAAITCWSDKYHWDFWRPSNAIQRAAEDDNPATEADPAWLPLISAPYPETPSGHLCLDGAHTGILQRFFGDRIAGGYEITSISALLGATDARTRSFDSLSRAVDELVEARIWAGLHFRFADVDAKMLGRGVAKYGATHYLLPVRHHHHHHHR